MLEPLPCKNLPSVTAPAKAFKAACAVVWPVPPLPKAKVPLTPGLTLSEPSKLAVLVLPKFVLNSLAFVSVAADPVVF